MSRKHAAGVYVVQVAEDGPAVEGVPDRAVEVLGRDAVARLQHALDRRPPDWTDANEHDPGVTLLELAAWLTESILRGANGIPAAAEDALARLAVAALRSLEHRPLGEGCALRSVRRGTKADAPP